jgi:hypothetical protein
MELASCHSSGIKGFEKAFIFLEKFCTRPIWKSHLLLLSLSLHISTASAIVRGNCNQSLFRTLVLWVAALLFWVRVLVIVFWGHKSSTRGKVSYIGLRLPREEFRTCEPVRILSSWMWPCVSYLISTCVWKKPQTQFSCHEDGNSIFIRNASL